MAQKKNFLSDIANSWRDLLVPLAGKPAFVSALALMATYASLDCPNYAPFLLAIVLASFRIFPKSVQVFIVLTMAIGMLVHEGMPAEKDPAPPPGKGCGRIEAVLPRANGTAFLVRADKPYAHRVRITEKRNLELLPLPGDSICYEASWYPVTPPTVPGAFNTKGWLKSQGLSAYGKFLHWESRRGAWTAERSFFKFRTWIKSRFDDYLTPSETGLLLGLLAGDRSGIPEALRSDFQRSGLVHVLAISGFHVVLLAGLLMTLLKATRLPHKAARIAAIILMFIYVPVTGASPAVRRAVLMFSVPQLGALLQRPADTFNSLGVALLFILIPNPNELWNPGFQLSVAATAGILIGSKENPLGAIPDFLKKSRVWGKLQDLVINPTYVTLCATIATAPFLIHHFKTLSPFAWLGNIIVVPAISWGMQAGLFALLSPFDILRQYFCYAASFFLRLAGLFTRTLSDSAEASITVGPFSPAALLFAGFLFSILPSIRKNRIARIYALCSLLAFSVMFCIDSYTRIVHPTWTLTAIDIGQGDSILITTPSGKHILVDAGPNDRRDSGKDIIVPYLHHIGVRQLDALVVSHPDADHFGGSGSIVKMFPVKEIWISHCAVDTPKPDWQEVLRESRERDIPIRIIHRGFRWKESLFEIEAVHPRPGICGETNEESITLRAKGLGHSAVLTGDLTKGGEKEILKTTAYLKSDVLKVGHHGSKTSSSPPFLTAVAPRLALISSGRKNRFRHPHKQVTARLDSLHIPYLNTAKSGTVTVTFSEDSIAVETMLK